jgi:hypothetical protein
VTRPTCTATCLRVVLLCALAPQPAHSQAPSVSDLVARCARAMAPRGSIDGLRTLRFETVGAGGGVPTSWEIVRPNLVRKTREGAWVLVFDGSRAAYLEGPRREDGTLRGPHLVPEGEWADFELDIALHVPAFFDFPAEYAGTAEVDRRTAYLLRVTLPRGGVVVYGLDAEGYLPVQVELPSWGYVRRFGDFREHGGFILPHRYWSPSDSSQVTTRQNLVVNQKLAADRFRLPPGIR